MVLQRNLEVKGGKIDRDKRKGYTVLIQHATDWDGPCFHLHLEINKPFTKSMYQDMRWTFDDIMFQYFEHPMKTIVENDPEQIKLVNHFGFDHIATLEGGYLYYEWMELR